MREYFTRAVKLRNNQGRHLIGIPSQVIQAAKLESGDRLSLGVHTDTGIIVIGKFNQYRHVAHLMRVMTESYNLWHDKKEGGESD